MKIVAIIYFCIFLSDLNAQPILMVDKLLEIGEENPTDLNLIFSSITDVAVNLSGDIFIANHGDKTIRMFDKNGEFIKKFGGKGKGPGEFLDVTSISASVDNWLTAVDRYQDRITQYNSENEDVETYLLPETSLGTLLHSWVYPDNQNILLLYRRAGMSRDDGSLLHVFGTESETLFGHHLDVYTHFFDKNKPVEMAMAEAPRFFMTPFGGNNIAVAPSPYTGTVALFNIETFQTERIGTSIKPFYQEYNFNRREYHRSTGEKGFVTNSGPTGKFFYKRFGSTIGLVGNSNYLMHFYILNEGTEMHTYVSIYSKSGQLLKNQSLDGHGIQFHNGQTHSATPHFLDENNVLYVAEYSEYPTLRLYSTNLTDF